jgi:Spy/CpxP family protein refolding chaperone
LAASAVLAVAVVGFLGVMAAVAQEDAPPPPPPGDPVDHIAERLKERGINLSPEQMDRARQVMDDIRSGEVPDPNQIRIIFADVRKQVETQRKKRLQELLEATDEEWKLIEPKIEKVRELARLTGEGPAVPGMMMGRYGGFLRSRDPNTPQPELEKKTQALRSLLGKKDARPEEVTSALKEYRAARAKALEDLAKARQELRELLSVKQEAQLVTMDLLE